MGWVEGPVVLFIALFSMYTPALWADVRVGENVYPDTVNLSHLSPENKIQKGGSCHVHAAASLFEAICYRDTGHKVNLSEAYLFYRHLRQTIARRGIDPTHVPPPGSGYTQWDGGDEFDTLRRLILSHSALVEDDTKPEAFYDFLENWLQQERSRPDNGERDVDPISLALWTLTGSLVGGASSMALVPKCERSFAALALGMGGAGMGLVASLLRHSVKEASLDRQAANRFAIAADEAAEKAFGLQGKAPGEGLWGLSEDEKLSACLERRWYAEKVEGTTETILSLLSRGHPFVCADDFDFGTVRGPHAALVVGYRFNGNQMQLLIHNADGAPAAWWNASDCRTLTVLASEAPK